MISSSISLKVNSVANIMGIYCQTRQMGKRMPDSSNKNQLHISDHREAVDGLGWLWTSSLFCQWLAMVGIRGEGKGRGGDDDRSIGETQSTPSPLPSHHPLDHCRSSYASHAFITPPPCQLQNETKAECGIVHHLQYFTHPPDHARPKNQQNNLNCSKICQIGIFRRHYQ